MEILANLPLMVFRISDTGGNQGIENYPVKDTHELLFVLACVLLRNLKSEIASDTLFTGLEKILHHLPFTEFKNSKIFVHPEKIFAHEKVIVDAASAPETVFGLSIIFSGLGMEADIKGIENYSTGAEAGQIACLQRVLYRLNINTDFCGGSKFKVYNNKVIKAPDYCLKFSAELFPSWLLMPLAIKTGSLILFLDETVIKQKEGLINAGGLVMEHIK